MFQKTITFSQFLGINLKSAKKRKTYILSLETLSNNGSIEVSETERYQSMK